MILSRLRVFVANKDASDMCLVGCQCWLHANKDARGGTEVMTLSTHTVTSYHALVLRACVGSVSASDEQDVRVSRPYPPTGNLSVVGYIPMAGGFCCMIAFRSSMHTSTPIVRVAYVRP